VHITYGGKYGHDMVLLGQQCNMLCSSGFVDDEVFSQKGPVNQGSSTTLFRRVRQVAAPGAKLLSTTAGLF